MMILYSSLAVLEQLKFVSLYIIVDMEKVVQLDYMNLSFKLDCTFQISTRYSFCIFLSSETSPTC